MFDDRRKTSDRRVRRDPAAIPPSGCRRRDNRRDRARRYQAHPWWLMATYAEEVEPPELQNEAEERGERRAASLPSWLTGLGRRKGDATP